MRISRVGAALGAVAALQGCSFDFATGPGADESVPEVHGRDIASASSFAEIRWSPSGDQVTFLSADLRTAFAYQLLTGVTRPLFAVDSGGILDVQFSTDGQEFFTSSNTFVIRRHTATGTTVLTDSGAVGLPDGWSGRGGLLVAPGQAAAAYVVRPDRLFLVRRGEEPTLIGSGCSGLIVFSPDESRVVCAAGSFPADSFVVFHLNGGAVEPLVLPTDVASGAGRMHWDANGIKLLYCSDGCSRLALYDQATGSSRVLLYPTAYPEIGPRGISWSRDGTKVAYWDYYCAQADFLSCPIAQKFLYVLDLASGTTKRVAVHTLHASSGTQLALSPTGSTMAYVINDRLFLLDVK